MEYSEETIIDKLNKISATITNAETDTYDINNTVTLTYDFDSLRFMNFITEVELVFDLEFEENITYEELNNYENLVHLI